MRLARPLVFACTLVMAATAFAAPGDVVVPAHRTKDGQWVPANVPPSSGGTRMVRKLPVRTAKPPAATATSSASPPAPPLLVTAEPIRR